MKKLSVLSSLNTFDKAWFKTASIQVRLIEDNAALPCEYSDNSECPYIFKRRLKIE